MWGWIVLLVILAVVAFVGYKIYAAMKCIKKCKVNSKSATEAQKKCLVTCGQGGVTVNTTV